ncbi:MAG: VWA domain-containing protein [Acidobacteriota bacterium]
MSRRNLLNPERNEILLRVACSPDKEDLFGRISQHFNSLQFEVNEELLIVVEVTPKDNQEIVESALQGEFSILCPDSTIWAEEIETNWQHTHHLEASLVDELAIFAVSPLVIAMRPSSAQRLGYPKRPIGWSEILREAQENPEFQWAHPHIRSTAGLLTAFAEFYVAAGQPEQFSQEHIQTTEAINFVRLLEQRVQQYGPSEREIISHAFREGEWCIDAFVAQERLVLSSFRGVPERNRPIIIYPKEGAVWVDHPLVLLSHEGVSSTMRSAYRTFRDYLLSADIQSLFNIEGFRAAGPHMRSYFSAPPISPMLSDRLYVSSVPVFHSISAPILGSVAKEWLTAKHRAAVYLLADTSGSMRGEKLEKAKMGLLAFLNEFGSLEDAVGLITFDKSVVEVVPIGPLSRNLSTLEDAISRLAVDGNTSMLDAVSMAYDRLHQRYVDDPIRAIVVMTDGLENASRISAEQLKNDIIRGNNAQYPVAVFGLAYGQDADLPLLNDLSGITGGSAMEGNPGNIQILYRRMSTFV